MNPEDAVPQERIVEPLAGDDQLEPSESWSSPATPSAGPPGPPASFAREFAEDEPWEDAWAPEVDVDSETLADEEPVPPPIRKVRRRGTLAPGVERPQMPLSPQQKLLILDTWQRSGLPARDFSALVNVSHHTLYSWKKRFEEEGPAGLTTGPRVPNRAANFPN